MSLQIKWHTSIDVIQKTRVPSDVHNCNLNYEDTFQGFSNKRETQLKKKNKEKQKDDRKAHNWFPSRLVNFDDRKVHLLEDHQTSAPNLPAENTDELKSDAPCNKRQTSLEVQMQTIEAQPLDIPKNTVTYS